MIGNGGFKIHTLLLQSLLIKMHQWSKCNQLYRLLFVFTPSLYNLYDLLLIGGGKRRA